jgi:hypothetical protein
MNNAARKLEVRGEMSKVTWDSQGRRLYHAGVDRGMLYVGAGVAVAWNGLVSVTESPVGGDGQPYYLDGQKALDLPAGEDFAAKIETFASPIEFAPCAGRLSLALGLYAGNQPPATFGFSYRTLIGNDSSANLGYKINIVYNALALVADFEHTTISASPSIATYSFGITTVPIAIPGYRPTAHVIFDSRLVPVSDVETILYGDTDNDPRLPTVTELATLLAG